MSSSALAYFLMLIVSSSGSLSMTTMARYDGEAACVSAQKAVQATIKHQADVEIACVTDAALGKLASPGH